MAFDVTLEEFKRGVAEFSKAAPTADRDALENGNKAVGLMYLGLKTCDQYDNMPLVLTLARGYLRFAHTAYFNRDIELDMKRM